ncbi:hypothetical protein FDP41_005422 [Naegleria fowleri]|uniref:Uncharacterized protein n=1 Tax=Naegleria fowleri TaxID=5763 RepID=A0A6A5BMQ3_NAEFO|nr:uncharacterized protein FDP41_005422 [Naegleria fowleri]KAF0975428.1 hypothetical protein FDP41_005422 [Naegleria fowleri]CAG4717957.1 unnamed protein product [Naegleria fowleri]
MSSPTGSLGPSSLSTSSNVSLKLTPFLKTFLTVIYWEPIIFEMLFGLVAMLFSNSRFVLGCLMPQPLVELLLVGGSATTTTSTTTNIADMTLTTNNDLRNLVFFQIRFSGLLLFAFGCIHHLILRHCYKELALSNLAYMVESVSLFHWTILGLCIGDLLNIGLVWNFILKDALPNAFMLVGGDILGAKASLWPILQVVVLTVLSSVFCILRICFLFTYSGKMFGIRSGLPLESSQQHIRRVHVE